MDARNCVVMLMLAMSVGCFILYILQNFGVLSPKPVTPAKQLAQKANGLTPASVGEMTDLLKALAALTDSLGKIGPAVTALVGSIFFAAIAALASGALPGSPPPPPPKVPASVPTKDSTPAPKVDPTPPAKPMLPKKDGQ